MNRMSLAILSSLLLCSTLIAQSSAIENEVYVIQDSQPGHIISGVQNQTILFTKNTTAGISFSAVLKNGKQLTNLLKDCNIKNGDTNAQLMNLYDFVAQGINTKVYASSILVDCSKGIATSAVFLVQSQKDLVIFDSYKVYDQVIPPTNAAGSKSSIGVTLLTTGLANIYVVSAKFTSGQSFRYGLGTPDLAPKYTINSTTSFPYFIPQHQLATTFYFNGADLTYDIRGGYIPQNCSGTTIIDQNTLQNNSFMFPNIGSYYQLYNTQLACQFKIVTKSLDYIPQIEMNGYLVSNTIISVTSNNGFGIYYAPVGLLNENDDYRGSTLAPIYYLPSDGVIDINAFGASIGFFSLKVSFVPASDSRSNSLNVFANTSRVTLESVSASQYQLSSSNAGAPQISLSLAPANTASYYTGSYDNCFLNILRDKSPLSTPVARYSLRQFAGMTKPIYFQNGVIKCQIPTQMYGYMLVRLNTADNFNQFASAMARIGVDQSTRYNIPQINSTSLTNIITILVENTNQESTLNVIGGTADSPVAIHTGGESAPITATVHRSDLSRRTAGRIITYETQPMVTYLEISVTNSGKTVILNSMLLLVVGYFLH
ncbi:unnamed protein product [Auanema sp. JU1783]|nr:unnamed protein product [Auanema sp. JU1783]